MDPQLKRRYNTTYKLRKSGFVVDTKRKTIPVYFRQVSALIGHQQVIILVKEYKYKLVENRQMELPL
jgi:hypothetical protein